MPNDGEEIKYRGVRKRRWGKYVAEIRSGRRSRISLGSYFTPDAAARAYDTALLCLRGPNATSFNFPDAQLNSNAMEVAANPSPHAIRTAAIAVGSAFDTIPPPPLHHQEAGPSVGAGASVEEVAPAEASTQSREAVKDKAHRVAEEEEEEIYTKYLLQSPEYTPLEESVQMRPLQPELQVVPQPYDQSEVFPDLATWDAASKPPP